MVIAAQLVFVLVRAGDLSSWGGIANRGGEEGATLGAADALLHVGLGAVAGLVASLQWGIGNGKLGMKF